MTHKNQLITLLESTSVQFIKVDPNNSLEQNAKNLNSQTCTVLRHTFLKTNNEVTLTILPFNELIDFKKINAATGAQASIIPLHACHKYHPTNNSEQILPIEPVNTNNTYIASTIKSYKFVIFECGKPGVLVKTTPEEFSKLVKVNELLEYTEETSAIEFTAPSVKNNFTPDSEKRSQLERLYKLPSMPQMANELIILKNSPKAHANDLAELIKKDPSLSAQLIRHAKSAFFNYQGEINTVNEAISRVLGFNSAINIGLGLSLGKKLKNPPDGPLGLNEFWKHAIYSATLAQALSKRFPKSHAIKPDLAYLCGLLHNIGFLLLGHMFQPEFFLLNRLYAANLTSSITCIEKHSLGMGAGQNAMNMGHSELGSWLLEKWNLPTETIVTAREHHSLEYSGEHANYSLLITLVNNAVGLHGVGDHREECLNEDLCAQLGISSSIVLEELETLMLDSDQMATMIKQFAG